MKKQKTEKSVKLVIELEPQMETLLRACAAFDEQTREKFALAALKINLACCAEAIGSEARAALT